LRGIGAGTDILKEIVEEIDVIEVFNSRSPLRRSSRKARSFAVVRGKLEVLLGNMIFRQVPAVMLIPLVR